MHPRSVLRHFNRRICKAGRSRIAGAFGRQGWRTTRLGQGRAIFWRLPQACSIGFDLERELRRTSREAKRSGT